MSKYGPDEVERYLADVNAKYQPALRRVVRIITEELGVQPVISYQIIGWRINGKMGLFVSGWKDHLSFHGGHALEHLAEVYPQWLKLKGATLWFQDEPELPVEIIKEVIATRVESLN
ncbi:MAG: hypothetical protein RJA26_278 [Actinomycetota bacterium]|jgi:hypothetical protein